MSNDNPSHNERVGFYAGSFNPFTIGHKSIVDRALGIFDRIIIGIGCNMAKSGDTSQGDIIEKRRQEIESCFASEPRVEVVAYEGLTAEAAVEMGACALIRGVRGVADFESERTLADINREVNGIETVIFMALPEYGHVSSSMVRELSHFRKDVSRYLP